MSCARTARPSPAPEEATLSDETISNDLKTRIRASQAKSAIRQMAGFRARPEDLAAACHLLADRFPELDLAGISAQIVEEQASAASHVAKKLAGSAIAARAERAYADVTRKAD